MNNTGDWSAYLGESKGPQASIGFKKLVEGVTKRAAHTAMMTALGGSHSAILRRGHTYFAVATKKSRS